MSGIRTIGVFVLDEDSVRKVKHNPQKAIGKIVAVTGNCMVGFENTKRDPLGTIVAIEVTRTITESSDCLEFLVNVKFFD